MDLLDDLCEICGREGLETTEHHLIPKEEGGKNMKTARLCVDCHKQIHALYSNKELAVRLYTIDKLKNDEKIKRYLNWMKRQPTIPVIRIKKSREKRVKVRN